MSSPPRPPAGTFPRVNTILYCRRWGETVRFYRNVIGLAIRHETDWFVEFRLNGGAFLSIADASRASIPSAAGAGITLSLEVEDVDAARRAFTNLGLAPTPIREIWGARAFFLFDPEGHRIELWSAAPAKG